MVRKVLLFKLVPNLPKFHIFKKELKLWAFHGQLHEKTFILQIDPFFPNWFVSVQIGPFGSN